MTPPWLSILVPVYNVEAYLSECLNSIKDNLVAGVEIIAVNDASTDNSLSILQEFSQNNPGVLTILNHHQHLSVSASRNTLLDNANGEYIWFVDSDDVMERNAIASAKAVIDTHQPDLILCDFRVLREKTQFKHKARGEEHRKTFIQPENTISTDANNLFEGLFVRGQLHLWTKIAKRSMWGSDLRFPVGKLMEDVAITPLLLLRAKRYIYVPEVWIAYRQRVDSILSTRINPKRHEDTITAIRGILPSWLQKHPNLPASARFAFAYFCATLVIGVSRAARKHKQNRPSLNIREEFFTSAGIDQFTLVKEYLRRGWIIRLLRLHRHLRKL